MKKIISISLFIIICINHLNIMDAVMNFNTACKKGNIQTAKNLPIDEESETGKEKGKEKAEEQEKYYGKNGPVAINDFQFADKDKFLCFSTALNLHPFQDDDIQPPKAV